MMRKKYSDGSVHPTNTHGNITIIGKSDKKRRYLCQFEDGT